MTRDLTDLGKGIADGKASISQLPDVLAKYGLSASAIELSSAGQFSDDMGSLSAATQALVQTMIAEAEALAAIGDSKDAHAAAAAAAALTIPTGASKLIPGTNINFAGFVTAAMMRDAQSFAAIPKMASGGNILRDGLIYAHRGEEVRPAQVARGTVGGGGIMVTVNAPNYIGPQEDLVRAIKSPALVEAVATAVLMANRRGHIRASQLN
jgi:hypothetical protein